MSMRIIDTKGQLCPAPLIATKKALKETILGESFIVLTDLFSMIWAIFFTDIGIVYKIIAGVSGFFGAIFMLAILITTFIQYKQLVETQKFMNEVTINTMKGGLEEWRKK